MDRRLLLAIGLMIGLMILTNVLFPPVPVPPPQEGAQPEPAERVDTAGEVGEQAPADVAGLIEERGDAEEEDAPQEERLPWEDAEEPEEESREIVVRSDLYEYRFDTRGARLTGATMLQYESYAAGDTEGALVELLRPDDALFGYAITVRGDSLSLEDVLFEASATDLEVTEEGTELHFVTPVGRGRFEVTYTFSPEQYRFEVEGGLRDVGAVSHAVLVTLGSGLAMNEAVPREDAAAKAVVTRDMAGEIRTERMSSVDAGELRPAEGGPFSWVASKSKYWLAAVVSTDTEARFGGAMLRGIPQADAAEIVVNLPVAADAEGFSFLAYTGPQEFQRLQDIGQGLHNVNPSGWAWLRWFTRPFGNLIVTILIWMHETFTLAYGWVLILFGIASNIVLFPLYQISMRQQMKQMAIQPEFNRIKELYKGDPQKMQQEQMKLYREHGVNPIGGCLPMLLPLPILITLFFVFQNTIEFRGVPFLWLPDLSLVDPLYIVPVLMGGSMLLLNWIMQRGAEMNTQMKVMSYGLPIVFTFMFARFAAGLNLYYTASNFARLPQQLYLSAERRKARAGHKK